MTAPVLAVVVCHDGEQWLGTALSALRRQRTAPRYVVAVDTGSVDGTAMLLSRATDGLVDRVLTLPRGTGFAEAVHAALDAAPGPVEWLWVLHDDCAPEPECLTGLLAVASAVPRAAVLGPLSLDWADPELVVEAGVSTDASGHRQTGLGGAEPVAAFERITEALAVPSAGSLILRSAWDRVGGYDRRLPLLREDVDFGWRVNRDGGLVLCVPTARMRHARAATRGVRRLDAVAARPGPSPRGVDRAHGLRTFLVNCGTASFVLGIPRVFLLVLLRALGFLALRRFGDAHAEVGALRYLASGRAGLVAARACRPAKGVVPGLFTSRFTRLRNAFRGFVGYLVRRRVEADAALGRLPPATRPVWTLPSEVEGPPVRLPGGLRHVAATVRVDRPSPVPRFVGVDRWRVLRSVVFGPPCALVVGLVAFALVAHAGRFGLDLAGGRVLPVPDGLWEQYLATWHPVSGGTMAPAPAASAVLAAAGVLTGGPAALVSLLFLFDAPLAGLAAYAATRRAPVRRPVRALVAAAYAVLPGAVVAVAEGRLDVVVVHLSVPVVFAGLAAVLRGGSSWLPVASGTSLVLACLGAFAPLLHAFAVVAALVGFVVVPGPGNGVRRRVVGLFMVVLLPVALLLPWPAAVVGNPSILLHGVGAVVPTPAPSVGELAVLSPGGGSVVGVLVVVFALVLALVRPSVAMVPGVVVAVVAVGAVWLVRTVAVVPPAGGPAFAGFVGGPLLVVGWGLLGVVLAAFRQDARPVPAVRVVAVAGALSVLGLAGSGVAGLAASVLTSTTVPEFATGRSVLVLGTPTRQVVGRLPAFGDDDLVPTLSSPGRLARWHRALTEGSVPEARSALAAASAAGVGYVVVADRAVERRVRERVGELVAPSGLLPDGRPVLRVQLAGGTAVVLSPDLARQARTGASPPASLDVAGLTPVEAAAPYAAVRVSEGAPGRLVVIAAEEEPGWRVTVDGRVVAPTRAWGHLVAVPVPPAGAEVRVEASPTLRSWLLLVQAAATLFTLATALPTRP
ncbi:glycosyltransferase family 2 protein [Saccharothrix violaceirubra]|uniref:GT2 family glycosyltransferase n=1 Tax=Saccharothrix violaceirubra TaxID=413306 RepID=A0A7W7SYE4_9PSEU|nr:glycosyltransferase [Saccharothrix violaceirubra]MBB4963179.1 GT2 family glycosyltransferase [Saccharothrix violaceirubra]